MLMLDKNLQTVIAQRPLGLVFDFDGTLSSIAPTSEEARLYPGVAALLERARVHAHVAIMTGRAIEDGAEKVNVEGLTYIGTHGLEWSDGLPSMHAVEVVPEFLPGGAKTFKFTAHRKDGLPLSLEIEDRLGRRRVYQSVSYYDFKLLRADVTVIEEGEPGGVP